MSRRRTPSERGGPDACAADRHRHRRHLHRRRAGRRRDRRDPRRQGAHDPGGPGAGLHGRPRARPRGVPGEWPRRGRRRPRHDGRDERDHRGQDGARRHAGDARLPRHPRDRPPDPLAPLRRAPAEAGAPRAATLQSRGNRAPRPRGARAPAARPRRGAPGCAATAARRRRGGRRLPPALLPEPRSRARCRRDRPRGVAGCFPVGVIAAGAIAAPYGYKNVMSFDMGGTTAKVGLIQDGQLRLSTEIEVGAQSVTPLGEGRGGGYPIRTPVIDLVEVGAGGGSEAWIDAGGALRVGPRSAGARPGPACYGRGGTTPTITDANLVLGRLNPAFFLGGEMALDAAAARNAIADRVAAPLALDPIAAAAGLVEIANAHMIGAMRLVSVQRGYDTRQFLLGAFGGAGPLHANALAPELGIPAVLVPPNPGIASAVGMLMTDLRHEFVTTRRVRLDALTPEALESLFADFLVEGSARLDRDGVPASDRQMLRSVDLRYHGPSFELSIAVPAGVLTVADVGRLRAEFDAAHERAYGYAAPEDAVELVNVRLAAIGVTPRPRRAPLPPGARDAAKALKGTREVWFAEIGGWRNTSVLDRAKLLSGNVIGGPAIVEEHDASTLVHPGWEATVDQHGNLVVRAAMEARTTGVAAIRFGRPPH